MLGVKVGKEEADGHRLRAGGGDLLGEPGHLVVREALDDPLGPGPLGDLEAQLGVDQRPRLRLAEAVEVGAILAPDLDQVGEAPRRNEGGAGAALFEQRVGAHGHAVGEDLHVVGPGSGPVEHLAHGREDPGGLIVGIGRQLRRVELAAGEQDGVSERSADVDPEQHARKLAGRCNPVEPGFAQAATGVWSTATGVCSSGSSRCLCDGQ